jgi:hypothetical protein
VPCSTVSRSRHCLGKFLGRRAFACPTSLRVSQEWNAYEKHQRVGDVQSDLMGSSRPPLLLGHLRVPVVRRDVIAPLRTDRRWSVSFRVLLPARRDVIPPLHMRAAIRTPAELPRVSMVRETVHDCDGEEDKARRRALTQTSPNGCRRSLG